MTKPCNVCGNPAKPGLKTCGSRDCIRHGRRVAMTKMMQSKGYKDHKPAEMRRAIEGLGFPFSR